MRKAVLVLSLIAVVALAGCNNDKKNTKTEDITATATDSGPTSIPATWTPSPEGFVASPTFTVTPGAAPTERPGGAALPPTWTPGEPPSQTPPGQALTVPTDTPPGFVPSETPPGFVASPLPQGAGASDSGSQAGGSDGGTGGSDGAGVSPTERPGGGTLPPTWTPGRKPTITPRVPPTAVPPTLGPAATWTPQPDWCYALQITSEDSHIRINTPVDVSWTPIPGYDTYQLNVYNPSGALALQEVVTGTSYTLPGKIFINAGGYGWEVWPLNAQGERICFSAGRDIIVEF
jgi:hypothetical protein